MSQKKNASSGYYRQAGADNNQPNQTEQEPSQHSNARHGVPTTRIVAFMLIILLFACAYYLLVSTQEQKSALPPPPQTELIITIPQE